METPFEEGDEDFLTVNIGKLFLEASPMFHAFGSQLLCIYLNSFPLEPSTYKKEGKSMDWIQLATTMLPAANTNLLVWNQQIFSVYTLINKTKYHT